MEKGGTSFFDLGCFSVNKLEMKVSSLQGCGKVQVLKINTGPNRCLSLTLGHPCSNMLSSQQRVNVHHVPDSMLCVHAIHIM